MQLVHPKQAYSVLMILPVSIRWFVWCILHKQVYHMHTYKHVSKIMKGH